MQERWKWDHLKKPFTKVDGDTDWPCTMKPRISSLERLTIHDTNTPPEMMTAWLCASHGSLADGRHLMRIVPVENGGSESEETWDELTRREMGVIFPKAKKKEECQNEEDEIIESRLF